jgi:hypothetical protein
MKTADLIHSILMEDEDREEGDFSAKFDAALADLVAKGMIIEHREEGKEPSYEIAPAGVAALGIKLN